MENSHMIDIAVVGSNTILALVTTLAAWDTVHRLIAAFRPRRRKEHGRHEA